MNSERAVLEAAISAEPRSEHHHRVFSDWLEEHGFDDEAAYHRRWTVEVADAEKWMRDWAENESVLGHEYDDYDDDTGDYGNRRIERASYADAIMIGHAALKSGYYCFGDDDGPAWFYDDHNKAEWFRNWSLITGIQVSDAKVEDIYFRCAC